MKKIILGLILILTTLSFTSCSNNMNLNFGSVGQTTLKIATTSSLKNPLNEIKTAFEEDNSNTTLDFEYDSSTNLTDSVVEGSIYDFIILSSNKDMNELVKESLVDKDTEKVLVKNSLVLVAPENSTLTSVTDLTSYNVDAIAIGDPKKTSSGQIAQNTLEKMDLYDSVEYKIKKENSVNDVLSSIKNKEAQVGIVFKTDAYNAKGLKIIYEFPPENYDAIVYPMAVSSESTNVQKSIEFEDFLMSDEAQKILANYGFTASVAAGSPTADKQTDEDSSTAANGDAGGQEEEDFSQTNSGSNKE